MDLTLNLSDLLQLGIVVVGVVVWLTRGRQASATTDASHGTQILSQGREIGELKKRLETIEADRHLIARLDERMQAMSAQLDQMHKIIGSAVQEGIKAALSAVLTGARRTS